MTYHHHALENQVDEEMAVEKEKLLADERKRIKADNDRNLECNKVAEEILLQNKMIMEAQQRKEFEARQAADSQRLLDIQRKVRDDDVMEILYSICAVHIY